MPFGTLGQNSDDHVSDWLATMPKNGTLQK